MFQPVIVLGGVAYGLLAEPMLPYMALEMCLCL